ncbi:MAG TPA: hypothetical protein VLZ54_11900 [Arenibacter sp.]|nr:hypothetical protein [Arenibacter sp.]
MAIIKPEVLPPWAEVGDKVQPTDVEISNGWPLSNVPPSRQRFNWFFNYVMNGIRYFSKRGLPDWDAEESYTIGDSIIGPDNSLYRSLTSNINKTPAANPADWSPWLSTLASVSGRLLAIQTFDADGIYTPTPGTNSIHVELIGSGGAGGGAAAQGSGQTNAGGGGGSGSYARVNITSGFAGAICTIGIGGMGVTGSNGNGGGATSFGSFVTCPGGNGGVFGPANGLFAVTVDGAQGGGLPTVIGAQTIVAAPGIYGSLSVCTAAGFGSIGRGAASYFGGNLLENSGSGGNGALVKNSQPAAAGGNGADGYIIIYEYS